jgi:hypothetical protein
MTTVWNGFHSPLAPHIEQYLTIKRGMGCKFASEDRMLRLLDRFLDEQGVDSVDAVDSAYLEAFMTSATTICWASYAVCSIGSSANRFWRHRLCKPRRGQRLPGGYPFCSLPR